MAVVLDGSGLTIETLKRIPRGGEKVELDHDSLERIRTCRAMLEDKARAHEIMYGVNTGIGEFSEVVLSDEQVESSRGSCSLAANGFFVCRACETIAPVVPGHG